MDGQTVLVFFAAVLGSLGFGLMFGNRGLKLLFSALGGAVCWGAYLIAGLATDSLFLRVLIAAVCAALYSELCARRLKAPATVFSLVSAMPLIPGGSLYYTMNGAMTGDVEEFLDRGGETLVSAAGIAVGVVVVSLLFRYLTRLVCYIRRRREEK